jgi:HD superfamily phosphohydrolase
VTPPEVVRDPLWNNIQLEPEALELLDTPSVQRLRYVRQLGHAFLVYPGATHTRFEHGLGAYHLARRALTHLQDAGHRFDAPDALQLRVAALLHDIGHYPFSHALEEAGLPGHEGLAERHLARRDLATVLERHALSPTKLLALIRGQTREPLAGLICGSVDVDKLDYLSRDAWMCGVPFGVIDVDRLLSSLTLAPAPGGRLSLALHEKGLAALESLLFARYQMYRNVYWHHAVRAATAMFKRLVRQALRDARVRIDDVALSTDDGLMHELARDDPSGLAHALRERRLVKRAIDLPASELPADVAEWPALDPDLTERVEDRLAAEVGAAPGELFLDFPTKQEMLGVDLPLVRRDGEVLQLTGPVAEAQLGLPRVAAELYRSARRLRVFTARPVRLAAAAVIELVCLPTAEVAARLDGDRPLLSSRGSGPGSSASPRRRGTRPNRSGRGSP